jgi:Fe2+ or Zn2+ uptake regulation protein
MSKEGTTDPLQVRSFLRASGHRFTHQRQLVLDVLQETQGHPDAETIFSLAKARDPKISLATVYRTLALLNEAGLINKHRLGEDHEHFETAQSTPHYHFTCLKCERVIEFEAPQVTQIGRELCEREGIQITEAHLHFSGYCSNCREGDSFDK